MMRTLFVLAGCVCAFAQEEVTTATASTSGTETATATTTTTTTKVTYDEAATNKALGGIATSICAKAVSLTVTWDGTAGEGEELGAGYARCYACAEYLAGDVKTAIEAHCLATSVTSIDIVPTTTTVALVDTSCIDDPPTLRIPVVSSDLRALHMTRYGAITAHVTGGCANGTLSHDTSKDVPVTILPTAAASSTCDQSAGTTTLNLPSYSGTFCSMADLDASTNPPGMTSTPLIITVVSLCGVGLLFLVAMALHGRRRQ